MDKFVTRFGSKTMSSSLANLVILSFITISFYTYFMYFVYLNKFNIIIPRYMYTYSCTARLDGSCLDLWRFIIVLLLIIIIFEIA